MNGIDNSAQKLPRAHTQIRAGRYHELLAIAVILLIAGLLRFVYLGHYPLVEPDEGIWAVSAKEYVFSGDWQASEFIGHALKSPLFQALLVVQFKVFGPSIWSARLISAAAGVLSVGLLYFLVRRLTGMPLLAGTAAVLLGSDRFLVALSRKAMLESSQLFFVLLAAVLAVARFRGHCWLAGACVAGAALVKVNAFHMLPVLLVLVGMQTAPQAPWTVRAALVRGVSFLAGAGLVFGGINLALYLLWPDAYYAAYHFDIAVPWFHYTGTPLVRWGRFGFDPAQFASTINELFRIYPFLLVFAVAGGVVALYARQSAGLFFGLWLLVSGGFYMAQLFNPPRYTCFFSPALAFLGAVGVTTLAQGGAPRLQKRILYTVVSIFVAYSIGYTLVSASGHRETKIPQINAWVASNTEPGTRIMASAYHCIELPRPTYYYWTLALRDVGRLQRAMERLDIDYAIKDSEWDDYLWTPLATNFEAVAAFPDFVIYRRLKPPQAAPSIGAGPQPRTAADAITPPSEPLQR